MRLLTTKKALKKYRFHVFVDDPCLYSSYFGLDCISLLRKNVTAFAPVRLFVPQALISFLYCGYGVDHVNLGSEPQPQSQPPGPLSQVSIFLDSIHSQALNTHIPSID